MAFKTNFKALSMYRENFSTKTKMEKKRNELTWREKNHGIQVSRTLETLTDFLCKLIYMIII